MGRGRQKAKQTKVARNLKYFDPGTDLRALEAELAGTSVSESEHNSDSDPEDDWDDYEPHATR